MNEYERLCASLHVLWSIALHRPKAHLAFLCYAPYRKIYSNKGCNIQLIENAIGHFVLKDFRESKESTSINHRVYFEARNLLYHIYFPDIAFRMTSYCKEITLMYDNGRYLCYNYNNNIYAEYEYHERLGSWCLKDTTIADKWVALFYLLKSNGCTFPFNAVEEYHLFLP